MFRFTAGNVKRPGFKVLLSIGVDFTGATGEVDNKLKCSYIKSLIKGLTNSNEYNKT